MNALRMAFQELKQIEKQIGSLAVSIRKPVLRSFLSFQQTKIYPAFRAYFQMI